jgi:hypothetical protein
VTRDRPKPIGFRQELGTAPAEQGTPGAPLSCGQNCDQDALCGGRRDSVVEQVRTPATRGTS